MKKLNAFIVATIMCYTFVAAQSPQLIPFQAIVRDSNNVIISNQGMSLRVDVLSGSPTGTLLYQEIESATTSQLGLLNLSIGAGAVQSGSMSGITWGSGPIYVEIEVDLSGGSNFTVLGTTQLQSVPYALYALNGGGSGSSQAAGQITYGTGSGVTSDGGFTRDTASQKTIISDSYGSQGVTQIHVDSNKAFMNYYDYPSGNYAGFFCGPKYPDWQLNSVCVASIVYDQYNQIKYGYYAVQDSSQIITGGTEGGAVVGTRLYSAYMDVAIHQSVTSPFNSLTVDTNGLHWMYADTDRYTFSNVDGTSGQVLTTNGAGTLSFTSIPACTPNAWNAHQVLTGGGNTNDTITVQTLKNNIYSPTTSISSLAVNLPNSPNDGDIFILTFKAPVPSITYLNGTMAAGYLSAATGAQQITYTYDVANNAWY